MKTEVLRHKVSLDVKSLEELDRQMQIEISKLTPGDQRILRGTNGKTTKVQVPEQTELEKVSEEVIQIYNNGLDLASQAESHPLIPMFEVMNTPLPPDIRVDHEQMKYDFYSVEITFSCVLPTDQSLLTAELAVNLNDNVIEQARRTRAYKMFPGRKDIQLFSTDLTGAVGIDAGMNVTTPAVGNQLISFTKASMDAQIKARFVVGPLQFRFRKAAIEVKGESDQNILWRYNLQSELTGTNDFKSIIILKVPQEADVLQADVAISVVPFKRRWILLKDILPPLTDHGTLPIEIVKGRS